jgi:hypothetical protein
VNIELDLPQQRAYPWLWALTLFIPIFVFGLVWLLDDGTAPVHLILLIGLVPVVAIVLLLQLAMRRQRAWVEDGVLHVVSTFYHRRIALASLDLDGARVLSLREQPQWKPWLRTNGFALPGMISGWYRLPQWRKAFAAYGDPDRVLCMDAGDYVLLLGAAHPTATLDKLRQASETAR